MDKNKKKITLLALLGVIIVFAVIAVIILLPHAGFPVKEASAIAIIGGADGPTTIYIGASGTWEMFLLCSLLLIAIDSIILIVKKIIEYKQKKKIESKYFILFILIFNIITVLLLFPVMTKQFLVLNALIALIYLAILFSRKKTNNGT
jgi:oxaloacetate decarboxylase beta subunit